MLTLSLAHQAIQEVPLDLPSPFCPPSQGRELEELCQDIADHGLHRPILLWLVGEDIFVIAGQRRLLAAQDLGWETIPAQVLPTQTSLKEALILALRDNRDRGWNSAELGLMWQFLCEKSPDDAPSLARLLGLSSPKLQTWAAQAATLPTEFLAALAAERLDLETGARLASWPLADQLAVLHLFEQLLPSKQKKRLWLDYLEDHARREEVALTELLLSIEIQKVLESVLHQGRPAAEEQARRHLWAKRHPSLAELAQRRQKRLAALKIPKAARLELDPSLEDLSFTLTMTFSSVEEFTKLMAWGSELHTNPDFQSLIHDDEDEAIFEK